MATPDSRAREEGSGEDADNKEQPQQEWAQCDNCAKWRRLPLGVDVASLPERWLCHMNEGAPRRGACNAPEEKDESDEEVENGPGKHRVKEGRISLSPGIV